MIKLNPGLALEKKLLRQKFTQARLSLPPEEWQARSQEICQRLAQWREFQSARTVLAYWGIRQEVDLSSLFTRSKIWGFPRCVGDRLRWHQWQPGDPLERGSYGIQEPLPESRFLDPKDVNLLLIPTLAGDHQGIRLGYGGGYYDRLLGDPAWAGVKTMGILFELAYMPTLPRDPWDIPLGGICTETRLELFFENKAPRKN